MSNKFSMSGLLATIMVIALLFFAIRSDMAAGRAGNNTESTQMATTTENIESDSSEEETETETETEESGPKQVGDVTFCQGFEAYTTENTVTTSEDKVAGTYSILLNEATGEIVAQRDANTKISPASMTKILTVLTAAEAIESSDDLSYDDIVEITFEATNYSYVNDCSNCGFMVGDQVKVSDLFYGTILPSGADAAVSLALYVAGSQEAFVDMMNEEVAKLGLAETSHFTNPAGIYDEDLYTTAYDMSMILKAAVENDFCREVLGTHVYTIEASENHPDGMVLSNWFLRRIEDHMADSGQSVGQVLGAKTGFVNESGFCAASYEVSSTGIPYICVVANSYSSWGCIYDHVAIYTNYAKQSMHFDIKSA